jgi:Na+-transporting NADH:ubiquinone oxidoreductase subunit A
MSKTIKIKKGFDIKLKGKAELRVGETTESQLHALKPADFPGLKPKLTVKAGDPVQAGTPLFIDKAQPEVIFTSPVSGKVASINRGDRRRILEVELESDGKFESIEFPVADPKKTSAEQVKQTLLASGLWPFIVQRPFGVVANATVTPRDIFVSGFDTAPLAPDYEFTIGGEMSALQVGFDAIAKLTSGKVYLGIRQGSKFSSLKGVETVCFEGPHPAGNVGIQIHHIAPINKGETVWTLNLQAVLFIGRLFSTGKLNMAKTIAICGSEVKKPAYYKVYAGASVKSLLKDKTAKTENERIISGNVLTGTKLDDDGYLGFFHNQLTIIPEGNQVEAFGWASPGFDKFTAGKTFLSKLMPKKEYVLNANFHGGERAFVLSGQYEKVLPMDILPVFLLKSIIVNDFDKMEQLGIYEVLEEDLALCEYVCTSKIEVQEICAMGSTPCSKNWHSLTRYFS